MRCTTGRSRREHEGWPAGRWAACVAVLLLGACSGELGAEDAFDGGAFDGGGFDGAPADMGATEGGGPDGAMDGGPPDFGGPDLGPPTPPPAALSTRSFTSFEGGSDPNAVALSPGQLRIDLGALGGATVHRATLDPYLLPTPQQQPRTFEAEGAPLPLLEPRRLAFDATEAVQAVLARGGTELVVDVRDANVTRASLDVLAEVAAPAPVRAVASVEATHRNGDTLLQFPEIDPPIAGATSTFGAVRGAREAVGPDRGDKVRYRIYRLHRPFDDLGDVIDAELVDEIAPLSGWGDERVGFDISGDRGGREVRMLPVDDLELAAAGTGIYVRRHEGFPGTGHYLVSHVSAGAESFETLAASAGVAEREGPGRPILAERERFRDTWGFLSGVDLRMDVWVRWAAAGEHPTPSQPFHVRVGLPLEPHDGPRPLAVSLHAFGGDLDGFGGWRGYFRGEVLVTTNLQQYTSYTGYHEATGNLLGYDEGTVQPYFLARLLAFLFDFAIAEYDVDADRLLMRGGSMGGAGTQFLGLRSGSVFASLEATVGNSYPASDITFEFEEFGFGRLAWDAGFSNQQLARFGIDVVRPEDDVSVWRYFDTDWWLERFPDADMPLVAFANGVNDPVIAWDPAWRHAQALFGARQPHVFVWGQGAHGQEGVWEEEWFVRRDEPLIAFANGSLDDELGATSGATTPEGRRNYWYRWERDSVEDTASRFAVALVLREGSPAGSARVDVTPRRRAAFRPGAGTVVSWRFGDASGEATVDPNGILTIPGLTLGTSPTTLELTRP